MDDWDDWEFVEKPKKFPQLSFCATSPPINVPKRGTKKGRVSPLTHHQ